MGQLALLLMGAISLNLIAACTLLDIKRQTVLAGSIAQITGRVVVNTGKKGAVHVIVFQPGSMEAEFNIVSDLIADPNGSFRVPAQPGTYFVGSFQDLNGDGAHQRATEPAAYFNSDGLRPLPFTLPESGRLDLEPLVLSGIFKGVPEVRTVDGALAVTKNIGRVVSLDDPMFSEENSAMGLWRPVDFLLQVGGGLFQLQEYQTDLVPVIFIHGINGSPANFEALVQALDKKRFQPWVLHYPTGLRLDVVSDYLDRAVVLLQSRYGFKQVYVVAYSMGGLVARSFVMKHEQRNQTAPVGFLMTVNSPMLGMSSAAIGLEYSPVVVPVWRDVVPDSEFVEQLRSWKLPARIPYHLVFSYEPGSGSDGVVPLESQIPLGLQEESVRLHGFQSSHTGILRDADFIRHFVAALASQESGSASRRP